MDFYNNDVSNTSSEERTASVSSLYSNNRQQENEYLACKLKQIAEIESRFK